MRDLIRRIVRRGDLGIAVWMFSRTPPVPSLAALHEDIGQRIAARPCSPADSRLVIGTVDGAHVTEPGDAIALLGDGILRAFTVDAVDAGAPWPVRATASAEEQWPPELPEKLTVGALQQLAPAEPSSGCAVPLGLLDDLGRREQRVWSVPLDGSESNLAIIGRAGSGRTTALCATRSASSAAKFRHAISRTPAASTTSPSGPMSPVCGAWLLDMPRPESPGCAARRDSFARLHASAPFGSVGTPLNFR